MGKRFRSARAGGDSFRGHDSWNVCPREGEHTARALDRDPQTTDGRRATARRTTGAPDIDSSFVRARVMALSIAAGVAAPRATRRVAAGRRETLTRRGTTTTTTRVAAVTSSDEEASRASSTTGSCDRARLNAALRAVGAAWARQRALGAEMTRASSPTAVARASVAAPVFTLAAVTMVDRKMVGLVTQSVASFIKLYLLLLFVRVLLTWFPNVNWMRQPWTMLRQVTDPYLNLFRNLLPPIMGQIDFTPILGFMVLQFLARILSTDAGLGKF
jgi:YggT family protein